MKIESHEPIDQETEIAGLRYILERRVRAAIKNQWGKVVVEVNIQNGRIASVRDSDETVSQTKRQTPS